ncbi:hypothetical protein BU17DRAFT_76775 [Hysterangium stoloniferum]|nr:hypothetical protein BU17DRAFT_76775 [Hysterangium stoloniferum]
MSQFKGPVVGSRINYSSDIGTIRYIGEVSETTGLWLGVEWDDPRRGKHNGTGKDGKSYFTCKQPNSGSFIRSTPLINFGCSFLEALSSKYIDMHHSDSTEKYTLGSSNGAIEVEAVGLNKIRNKLSRLETLREVSLDTENVAWAGGPGNIRLRCPNIRGLDLSRSLLPHWDGVAAIIEELPKLETLSLNFNRLGKPDQKLLSSKFSQLLELRLNGTLMMWEEIHRILPSFPSLRYLEFGLNSITVLTVVDDPSTSLTNIDTLNLEQNQLKDWSETLLALVPFKGLIRLILSNNKLKEIPFRSSPSGVMSQTTQLALTSNDIRSWSDIDALSEWFPRLLTLRINGNPISEGTISRPLIIARIPTLQALNASAATAERQDSELFYLSHIAKEGPATEEARQQQHPQYKSLCEKHGRPTDVRELPPDTLKSRLIELQLYESRDPTQPHEGLDFSIPGSTTLRVLPTMSLRVLRLKLFKTLRLSQPTNIRLWLVLERGPLKDFAEMELGMADKALEWWGLDENCKVLYYVH